MDIDGLWKPPFVAFCTFPAQSEVLGATGTTWPTGWISAPTLSLSKLQDLRGGKCTEIGRKTDKTRGPTWKNMDKTDPQGQVMWQGPDFCLTAHVSESAYLPLWSELSQVCEGRDPRCGPVRFSFSRSGPGAPYTTACPNGIGRSSCPSLNFNMMTSGPRGNPSIYKSHQESKNDYTWEAQRPTNESKNKVIHDQFSWANVTMVIAENQCVCQSSEPMNLGRVAQVDGTVSPINLSTFQSSWL